MNVAEYRERFPSPLRQATLCFLTRGDEILLAMKKRGFGEGRWNGVGGKCNEDESILEATVRETKEEIGVILKNTELKAILNFYFKDNANYSQQVAVYFCNDWDGHPVETEEMKPEWYKIKDIPFDTMWSDDILWLPKVLNGEKIYAEFLFDEGDAVLDSRINRVNTLETF